MMRTGPILLLLGALILVATALFHASGVDMVAGWVTESRRPILEMLWFAPAIDWAVVAIIWAAVGWRGNRRLAWLVWLTMAIPLAVAAGLALTVGVGFLGFWMLVGASGLAAAGATLLR